MTIEFIGEVFFFLYTAHVCSIMVEHAASKRVMEAMLPMTTLNIQRVKRAYDSQDKGRMVGRKGER